MTPPASAARRAPSGPVAARRRVTPALASASPHVLPGALPRRRQEHTPRRSGARSTGQAGLAQRIAGLIAALPEHRLLDRLMRGRLWIGLLAFSLIGIVAMQVLVLKLNTGIGSSLQREAQLQRENATISIENSTAAAGENIEPQATRRGMQIAPSGAVHFLEPGPSNIASAASLLAHWNTAPPSTSSASTTSEASATPTTTGEQPPPASSEAQSTPTLSSESAAPAGGSTSTATQSPASQSAASETGSATTAAQPVSASPSGSEAQAPESPAATAAGGTQASTGQG